MPPGEEGQKATTTGADMSVPDVDYGSLGAAPLEETVDAGVGERETADESLNNAVKVLGGGEELHETDDETRTKSKGDIEAEKGKPEPVTAATDKEKPVVNADRASQFRAYAENLLTKRLGKEYKLPADINEENFLPHYESLVIESLHPEVRRMQTAIQNGTKPEEYLQNYNRVGSLISMNDEQLLTEFYKADNGKSDKNPEGWTDEDIKEVVDGIKAQPGQLKLKAKEVRDELREEKRKQDAQAQQYEQRGRVDVTSPGYRQEFDTGFNASWQRSMSAEKTFYGVDLSKQENLSKVQERVRYLLFPNKATGGLSPFAADMNNPDNVVQMSLIWDLHKKGNLTKAMKTRTVTRGDFIESLDQSPSRHTPANDAGSPQIDIDALTRPEPLYAKG